MKFIHILFEILLSMQLTIVVIYWFAIFPAYDNSGLTRQDYWIDVSNHGIFYGMLLIDYILNAIKPYKRHWIILLIYMLCYFIVNVAVTLSDSKVYPIINWTNLISYVYAVAAMVIAFIHFCLLDYYFNKMKAG